jgi:hypothetical protein
VRGNSPLLQKRNCLQRFPLPALWNYAFEDFIRLMVGTSSFSGVCTALAKKSAFGPAAKYSTQPEGSTTFTSCPALLESSHRWPEKALHLLKRAHRNELNSVVEQDDLNLLTGRSFRNSRASLGMTTWNLGEIVSIAIGCYRYYYRNTKITSICNSTRNAMAFR